MSENLMNRNDLRGGRLRNFRFYLLNFMPLVFTGFTPHPPILLPTIGKEHVEKVAATKQAMMRLEQDLYLAKPNIIIIISPHMSLFEQAFSVNAHPHMSSLFEHFGDLTTKKDWDGAPELAATLSTKGRREHVPIQLVSQERIDH